MIRFENVGKRFAATPVIAGLSFEVGKGCVTGLLGPNGAGKTTTMRLITGFYRPDEGLVRVGGEGDPLRPEIRAEIGYLPENNPLYDDMTVVEHLHFVARLYGLVGKARTLALGRVSDYCALATLAATPVAELSKGMRQRLGLALALLNDPKILVLDEPATGLDPLQAARMHDLIGFLAEDRTVLLSTHQLQLASSMCRQLLVLGRGTLLFDGTPAAFHALVPPRQALLTCAAGLEMVRSRLAPLGITVGDGEGEGLRDFTLKGDMDAGTLCAIHGALEGLPVSRLVARDEDADACFANLLEVS